MLLLSRIVKGMVLLAALSMANASLAQVKCVIVIKHAPGAAALSAGQKVNTAAVLGATIGAMFPKILGKDLEDASGTKHPGISTLPITIVKQPANVSLNGLYAKWQSRNGVVVKGLTSDTSTTNTYEAYAEKLAETETEKVDFFGIALFGEEEIIKQMVPKEGFKLL